MNKISSITLIFFAFTFLLSCSSRKHALQNRTDSAASNKAIVRKGFEDWENGVGNLFPIVADSVKWTIENYKESTAGFISSPVVYHSKQELTGNSIKSLYSKLDGIIHPEVYGLYAEGDRVIAYWKGTAKTKSGLPFSNTYVWLMKLKGGKITELTAFLDMNVMNKLLNE